MNNLEIGLRFSNTDPGFQSTDAEETMDVPSRKWEESERGNGIGRKVKNGTRRPPGAYLGPDDSDHLKTWIAKREILCDDLRVRLKPSPPKMLTENRKEWPIWDILPFTEHAAENSWETA